MVLRLALPAAVAALLVSAAAAAAEPDVARLMANGLDAFGAGRHAEAHASFRALARRDIAAAETLLGTMTANGQGTPANDAVAAAWFLRAARRGYAPAQLALADAFARGRGVPRDNARALALAKAAAAQGQPGAARLALKLGPERQAMLVRR